MEVHNCTGGSDPNHPKEKEMQKGQVLRRPYNYCEKKEKGKGDGKDTCN